MAEELFRFDDGQDYFDDYIQSALSEAFYRLDCPDSEDLVDYQEGLLAFSRQREIKQHLTFCTYCQKEMVMLAELDEVPFALPPKAVLPPITWSELIERLKQEGKKILEAILPPAPPQLAFAVRGGDSPYLSELREAKPTQITRVYDADEYQIRLTITPPAIAEEIWKIHGEISHPTLWDLSGQIYLFRSDNLTAQTVLDEDEDGEFTFDELEAGQYSLLFDIPEAALQIDGFHLEWTPPELADLLLEQAQADKKKFPRLLEPLRPNLTLELIEEFKRRVDGDMYRNASRALEIAEVAETVADFIPNPEAKALALWAKGNPLHFLARNQEGLTYYQRAESIYAELQQQLKVAGLQLNQVAVLREMGEYQDAVTLYKKARLTCETIGPPAQRYLAGLEMNIGATYWLMGELIAALDAYERSYTLFASLPGGGQETRMAMIEINRANVLEEMDRFSEAEPLYIHARDVLAQTGYEQEVARVDLNLGILAYRRGQYQRALHDLEVARSAFAVVPNLGEVAIVDLYRSFVYRDLNMLSETIRLATEAEQTFEQKSHLWFQALALINQAVGHQRLAAYARAEERFAKARRILQKQGAPSRVLALDLERADLALQAGRLKAAQQLAHEVKQQLDPATWPSLVARVHILLAGCELASSASDLTLARQHTEQAQAIANSHNLHEVTIAAHHLMGQILEKRGDLQTAWQAYDSAIEKIEWLRALLAVDEFQLGFMEDKLPIYENSVRLCHHMATQATNGKRAGLAQMFYTLNLAVAAPLRRLPSIKEPSLIPDDDRLRKELETLREKWYWHYSKLEYRADNEKALPDGVALRGQHLSRADLYQELRQLEDQIAELIRRWQVRTTQAPLSSDATAAIGSEANRATHFLADVQAHLKPEELLLQYYLVDGQVQALLVTANNIKWQEKLISLPEFEKIRHKWHKLAKDFPSNRRLQRDMGRANKRLRRFYRALVASLEPHLIDCKKLFLITPPDWHDLPFSAFFDGQSYLANRWQLAYLSAPEALLRTGDHSWAETNRATDSNSNNALVIGYSDQGEVPQTVDEARKIAQLLQPHLHATLLLEEAATLSDFKKSASNSKLLHLASHAVFRADNPLFSWLHLANDRLTVAELYDQITFSQQPLVVLSACQTGLGQPRGGGLLGMARGFMVAGANGLIVTLWKVADHTTAELMKDFYTALLDHALPPSAALHDAKQQAIARGYHPYYWAGFIFIQG